MRSSAKVQRLCRSLLTLLVLCSAGCGELLPKRTPGEKLYRKHCADCHGIDGGGHTVRTMGEPNTNLLDDRWRYGYDTSGIENVIRQEMVFEHPTFTKLSPEDLKQITSHVRKLRGESRR